jgi:SOS-response transcriptional repressor LexA
MQVTTGYKGIFVPLLNNVDTNAFCVHLEHNNMAPRFNRGDYIVISPNAPVASGNLVAAEYTTDRTIKTIVQVNFIGDLIILEPANHKGAPVTFLRSRNAFRVIGRVLYRYQKMP